MCNIYYFPSEFQKKKNLKQKSSLFKIHSFTHKVFPKGSCYFFSAISICSLSKFTRKKIFFSLFSFAFYKFSPLPKKINQQGIFPKKNRKNEFDKKCFWNLKKSLQISFFVFIIITYVCMWHATFRENVKMHKNSNKENNCQKQSSTVEMSKIYKKITNELQNFWYFKAFKSVWIKSLKNKILDVLLHEIVV